MKNTNWKQTARFLALVFGVFLLFTFVLDVNSPVLAQKKKKADGPDPVSGKSAPTESGKPMLWEDRGDVSKLDLFWGIGSEAGAPKPPFTFVKEDTSGTNPKIKITDANGVKWNMKFDEEVHAEIACSRIVWACGFKVEESYYSASGTVSGVSGLSRAKKFVGSGSYNTAMLEKRPGDIARRGILWSWDSNPFKGTKEFSGLVIITLLLSNWDSKQDNNNVLGMWGKDGSTAEDWYVVADWGGTLGKMGGWLSHSKWDLGEYAKQPFLMGASGGYLRFAKTGKDIGSAAGRVPVEHAKWFCGIVGQLSEQQIKDAFRAAGASESDQAGFAQVIMKRIAQLKSACGE